MADGYIDPLSMDYRTLVDARKGTVDRRVYSDQQIFEVELERIFARAWNFMCHESQIPKVGDFFLTYIGNDSVIVVRDKTGTIQVLLNTCRHRGNTVCRADSGNTRAFLCTYHGWTFGLDGKLMGVPGLKNFYQDDLDRAEWGLIAAPHVTSYKGFVFANMDPEAPTLEEYLGDTGRIGLEMMAARGPVQVVDGVTKNIIGTNWKLPVDNVPDFYHPSISHASAFQSGAIAPPRKTDGEVAPQKIDPAELGRLRAIQESHHRVVFGRFGHSIGGPRIPDVAHERMLKDPKAPSPEVIFESNWRYEPEALEALGPLGIQTLGHPIIFPNLWVSTNGTQLCLRIPRAPDKTELWWFTLIDANMPQEERATWVQQANHVFGPAGLLEQEDGENWDQATRATQGILSKRYPFNFAMNLGHAKVQRKDGVDAAYVDVSVNEHAQLWLYRNWADWMTARNWNELQAIASPLPETTA